MNILDIENKKKIGTIDIANMLKNQKYSYSDIMNEFQKYHIETKNYKITLFGDKTLKLGKKYNNVDITKLLSCKQFLVHKKRTVDCIFRNENIGQIVIATKFNSSETKSKLQKILIKKFKNRFEIKIIKSNGKQIIFDITKKHIIFLNNSYIIGDSVEDFINAKKLNISIIDQNNNIVTDTSLINYSYNDKLMYHPNKIDIIFQDKILDQITYENQSNRGLDCEAIRIFHKHCDTVKFIYNIEYNNGKILMVVPQKYCLKIGNFYLSGSCVEDFETWENNKYKIIDDKGTIVDNENIMKYTIDDKLEYVFKNNEQNIIPVYGNFFSATKSKILLKDGKLLDNEYIFLDDFLDTTTKPFSIINIGYRNMQVFIRTLTGKTITISDISSKETVNDLKKIIQNKEGIPPDQQRLCFLGAQMDDDRMLGNYGILNEMTVHLILRLRGGGGGNFADVGVAAMLTGRFSESAPSWRGVTMGLNAHGICENAQCDAYNEEVICMKGYRTFSIDEYSHCPECESVVNVITCGFYNCAWKFVGMKKDGTIVNNKWTKTESDYKYFDNSKVVEWDYLIFSVSRPNVSLYNEMCPICLDHICGGINLDCMHSYHKECINEWFGKGRIMCPLCMC